MLAVGCLRHFKERAIECPNAISLVGTNDLLFMDAVNPGLTTIKTPTAELGNQAAAILTAMIKGQPVYRDRVVLTPQLLVRESVMSRKVIAIARSSPTRSRM